VGYCCGVTIFAMLSKYPPTSIVKPVKCTGFFRKYGKITMQMV